MYPHLIAFLLITLSTGCSLRSGLVRDSITTVQLDDVGFQYVQTGLNATKSRGYLLCIIGLPPHDMYHQLMSSLHDQAQLVKNETFVNLREDSTTMSLFGLYCEEKVTLSADVIRFTNATTESTERYSRAEVPSMTNQEPTTIPAPTAFKQTQVQASAGVATSPRKPEVSTATVRAAGSFWLTCGTTSIKYSATATVRLKGPEECTFTKGFKSHKFKLSPNDQVECTVGKQSPVRCEKSRP
jgi:hypothetical protein